MTKSKIKSQKEEAYKPTITDMISLEHPLQVKVSPNGQKVAYSVRITNWNKNCHEYHCYVHDIKQNRSFQLTRAGVASQFEWIDNESLAVLKVDPTKEKAKAQIWLFEHLVGEGLKITDHKTGVQLFRPFADGLLFSANSPEKEEKKSRKDKFGSYVHFEQEESPSALYYLSFSKIKEYSQEVKQRTEDEAEKLVKPALELSKLLKEPLKISSFAVSPSNDAIYLNCRSKDDLVYLQETSNYRIKLQPEQALDEYIKREQEKKEEEEKSKKSGKKGDSKDDDKEEDVSYFGELTKIALPKGATINAVSPDGTKLLINYKERDLMFYTQSDLAVLDLSKTEAVLEDEYEIATHLKKISGNLDHEIMNVKWVEKGIFTGYINSTKPAVAQLTEAGEVLPLDFKGIYPLINFDISKEGFIGFLGGNETKYPEVFVSAQPISSGTCDLIQLTNFGRLIDGWDLGTAEVIRWKSKDGTEIEGVLRKPTNFDPSKKYPLVFVVHGGPRWVSFAHLLEGGDRLYYPCIQFNNKEILVLKPNYRGSLGRGQAFAELNKENLGVGDLWDLESAINHLDSLGMIDTTKIGCMGWSQGGYISAFVGIHSKKFKAVSVGAGIGDWYTYHIGNDIPQFTTHYLSETPFQNRELYEKTAPLSKLKQAKTPTLIQHGEIDLRVPVTCAKELYRGLKDMNVHVELFIYPGMAHPITKPRENRAVMHQNLTWFSHYLLGEKLDLYQESVEEDD